MARKGFTSEFRQFYNRQKRKGFSDRAIAEELNISPSWFAAVKAGRGSFGRQSTSRIEAATTSSYDEGGGSDLYTITGDELRRLLASGNTRTARDARNAFADIQSQNPDLTSLTLTKVCRSPTRSMEDIQGSTCQGISR